jgi:hypothetical protein
MPNTNIPTAIIEAAQRLANNDFENQVIGSKMIWYEFKPVYGAETKYAFVLAKGKYQSLGAIVCGNVDIDTFTFQVHRDTNMPDAIRSVAGLYFLRFHRNDEITDPKFICIL